MPTDTPSRPSATTDLRVPVTLLTGFLGAGKTTLLNKVLADASSGRIAVIVNEFGEAGLDHDLIAAVEDDVVLMQSGCLCCSIRGDLSKAIADMLKRRAAGRFDFDRIVIETTGIAEPGPILQTMLMDVILARSTRMDGVVTVVDAANGPETLDTQFEAVNQVAMADLILLSKTDLVDAPAVTGLTARLRGLNPTAPIIAQDAGPVASARMWGLSGLRRDVPLRDAIAWTTPAATPAPALDPLANLSGLSSPKPEQARIAPHDNRIVSASVEVAEPLQDENFNRWLETLMALRGSNILRTKGIVFLDGIEKPFVFHGVQKRFNPPVPLDTWAGGPRTSRIVVIGRDMAAAELQDSFRLLRAGQHRKTTTTQDADA